MVIGIVVVVVIGAIAAAFLIGRSSGDDKATTATTPTQTQTTQTAATTPAQTTATVTNVQTVTQTPQPQPGAGVEIVEQSLNPVDPGRGSPIVLTARTRGPVASVKINMMGRDSKSVELVKGPTINDITNWTATDTAPAQAGAYTFKAVVTANDGATVEGPASPFTVLL
jgi:hypothetical protein